MVIRAYQPFDAVPLAALFYQTVHTVNRRDYTEKQLDAWAPKTSTWGMGPVSSGPPHPRGGRGRLRRGLWDIDSNTGYLDRLYVHKDHQGMGIATASVIVWRPPPPASLSPTLHHRAAFL